MEDLDALVAGGIDGGALFNSAVADGIGDEEEPDDCEDGDEKDEAIAFECRAFTVRGMRSRLIEESIGERMIDQGKNLLQHSGLSPALSASTLASEDDLPPPRRLDHPHTSSDTISKKRKRTRAEEYPQIATSLYLDSSGASIPPLSLIQAFTRDITTNIYGNPHSTHSPSSTASSHVIACARARILQQLNLQSEPKLGVPSTNLATSSPDPAAADRTHSIHDDEEDDPYSVIFTANATAAIKLVAECADWSDGCQFMTLKDSHTSVLGIREYLQRDKKKGDLYQETVDSDDKLDGFKAVDPAEVEELLNANIHNHHPNKTLDSTLISLHPTKQFNLFAYPAQSNFNGQIYPLSWSERFHSLNRRLPSNHTSKPWKVLIDASASGFLDLKQHKPDFVVLSFYKMFGFPSGLGALVLKRSAAECLTKKYFGGGSVDAVDPVTGWRQFRSDISARFEDGTVPFLDIVALNHGLDWLEAQGGWGAVKGRSIALADSCRLRMRQLRHRTGIRMCEIYASDASSYPNADDTETPTRTQNQYGPVIAFNLLSSTGHPIGSSEVLKLASMYDIHLRAGCFCNTGACSKYLGMSSSDIQDNLKVHRHVCGDNLDFVKEKRVSALRISFGDWNLEEDVEKWIQFLEAQFLNVGASDTDVEQASKKVDSASNHNPQASSVEPVAVLKAVYIYPIKSCAGLSVQYWPIGPTGFLYDRHFMIVDDAGNAVGQKRNKKILDIKPLEVDISLKRMVLIAPGMEPLVIQLDCGSDQVSGSHGTMTTKFCGNTMSAFSYSDPHVETWLSTFLGASCKLAVFSTLGSRSTSHKPLNRPTGSGVAFQNECQFLLASEESYKDLERRTLEGGMPTEGMRIENFRANLILGVDERVLGLEPFAEEGWEGLEMQIGDQTFQVQGSCQRCSVIGKSAFSSLAKARMKKMPTDVDKNAAAAGNQTSDSEDDNTPSNNSMNTANTSSSASKKKKKKKSKPAASAVTGGSNAETSTTAASTSGSSASTAKAASVSNDGSAKVAVAKDPGDAIKNLAEKLNGLGMLNTVTQPAVYKRPKDMESYKFWKTQPVPKTDELIESEGVIEEDKPRSEVRQEPYELNEKFEWSMVDIEDDAQIKEVYELLSQNYVEDDDATLRFDYSAQFLKWALQPPGWKKVWHLGVRVKASKKIVAFISGIPADLKIRASTRHIVEINFLCVHKKLRSKRLAPLLIKEITRLVNLEGIFQAVYTAGAVLPKAISTCRYYHRSLNPKKLVETGFSYLRPNVSMTAHIRLYKLPEEIETPSTRIMEPKDVPQVCAMLNKYLSQFEVAPTFTEAEVRHWMLPLDTVMYSYVVESPEAPHVITDFYSFYSLPSSVIGNAKHSHIHAAYLFYYVPKGSGKDASRTTAILKDALIQAKNNGFDVFNCLNLMHNTQFIDELKFGKGDGQLHYYLYNYRCRDVSHEDMALVLL
ncbi:hypothetical protein HDV05_004283 [Chytridiales sp. JEL 0842]|nr:hypothetical protein HDV05_004283 [Chytridiales sp. JEL 0842]